MPFLIRSARINKSSIASSARPRYRRNEKREWNFDCPACCSRCWPCSVPLTLPRQVVNSGFEFCRNKCLVRGGLVVTQASGGPVYAVRTNDNPRTAPSTLNSPCQHRRWTARRVRSIRASPSRPVRSMRFHFMPIVWPAAPLITTNIMCNGSTPTPCLSGRPATPVTFPARNDYFPDDRQQSHRARRCHHRKSFLPHAGAAVTNLTATLSSMTSPSRPPTPRTPGGGITNQFQPATIVLGTGITWFATNGVPYQVQWAANQSTNTILEQPRRPDYRQWRHNTVFDPTGHPTIFYQVITVQ